MAKEIDSQETRDFINALMKERGLNMAGLSRDLGYNDTYMRDYLQKRTPAGLDRGIKHDLATILGCTVEEIKAGRRLPQKQTQPLPGDTRPLSHGKADIPAWGARDLPLLGGVIGGEEGVFVDNGNVLGWLDRPPSLAGVKDAYAVAFYGESMEPRAFEGQYGYVNPHIPLKPGKLVVIQVAPEEQGGEIHYLVKAYLRRTQSHLVVEQYNPAEEIKLPLSRVIAAHRVVMIEED